ncbi:polysialyltransferase family glycosyltransferase [Pontibacter russatus]|uniref:polysialyltransferase family glycosyltransferase n=1 Tax=Pontibacter russatus TaxID=2694929 RepID=UPI00137B8D13|nr:polysialyltransferase family glycosyltransferase [Pontibacter russatus]
MENKPNILFVGDYNRRDYLDLLLKSKDGFNFFFLEFASKKEITNHYHKAYGKCIFWKDYRDAFDLLEKIKPAKVLFLYIEAYNHVALNIACKNIGIPTFHLEHGLRADYLPHLSAGKNTVPAPSLQARLLNFLTILREFRPRLKTRLFLLNSIRRFPVADAKIMKEFIEVRSKYNFFGTAVRIKSQKRQPVYCISFSEKIFRTHQIYDILPDQQKVFYIGIPYFDRFAGVVPATPARAVLLIDQPLAEHGLLNWTKNQKKRFIHDLSRVCSRHRFKLYVKPHPRQDVSLWQQSHQAVELINDEQLLQLAPSIPFVLGFYSTLLMPFAAFPHTAVVTYENHPIGRIDVSKSFIEAGVAHPVYSMQDLEWALQHIEQLHQKQLPNKAKFTEEWMYKFDGKAGERLRDILLSDKL